MTLIMSVIRNVIHNLLDYPSREVFRSADQISDRTPARVVKRLMERKNPLVPVLDDNSMIQYFQSEPGLPSAVSYATVLSALLPRTFKMIVTWHVRPFTVLCQLLCSDDGENVCRTAAEQRRCVVLPR